jgi:hypothetical protein
VISAVPPHPVGPRAGWGADGGQRRVECGGRRLPRQTRRPAIVASGAAAGFRPYRAVHGRGALAALVPIRHRLVQRGTVRGPGLADVALHPEPTASEVRKAFRGRLTAALARRKVSRHGISILGGTAAAQGQRRLMHGAPTSREGIQVFDVGPHGSYNVPVRSILQPSPSNNGQNDARKTLCSAPPSLHSRRAMSQAPKERLYCLKRKHRANRSIGGGGTRDPASGRRPVVASEDGQVGGRAE